MFAGLRRLQALLKAEDSGRREQQFLFQLRNGADAAD
jgi:hypothetical protein